MYLKITFWKWLMLLLSFIKVYLKIAFSQWLLFFIRDQWIMNMYLKIEFLIWLFSPRDQWVNVYTLFSVIFRLHVSSRSCTFTAPRQTSGTMLCPIRMVPPCRPHLALRDTLLLLSETRWLCLVGVRGLDSGENDGDHLKNYYKVFNVCFKFCTKFCLPL